MVTCSEDNLNLKNYLKKNKKQKKQNMFSLLLCLFLISSPGVSMATNGLSGGSLSADALTFIQTLAPSLPFRLFRRSRLSLTNTSLKTDYAIQRRQFDGAEERWPGIKHPGPEKLAQRRSSHRSPSPSAKLLHFLFWHLGWMTGRRV